MTEEQAKAYNDKLRPVPELKECPDDSGSTSSENMSDWGGGDDWDEIVRSRDRVPDDLPSNCVPQKYLTDTQAWIIPFRLPFPTLSRRETEKVDFDEHLLPTTSTPVIGRVVIHYVEDHENDLSCSGARC